jgi:putative oxidoreductase
MRHVPLGRLLRPRPDVGLLLFRVFLGGVLIYGTQDNIVSREQMVEFIDFVTVHGFPYPSLSAHLSVYAQFIAGLLILLGAATRPAALVMVVNFIVALAMVHVGLPFNVNIAPLAMLAGSLLLALHGAGAISVDASLAARRSAGQAERPEPDRERAAAAV